MNRKRLLLVVLLGILALSVGYAYWATPRQQRIDGSRPEARRALTGKGKAQETPETGMLRVRYDLLGEEPAPFPGAERDIFNFRQKPVASIPSPPKSAPQPAAVPPPPPPVPREMVQKSLSKFSFLGFLDIAGRKIVFLSSADEIYVVRQGDRFGRNLEFEAEDISGNILTVRRRGQKDTEKVFLVEKERLETSVSAPARMPPLPAPPVMDQMDASQGMSAPARRGRVPAVPGPNGTTQEMAGETSTEEFQDQEAPIDMENPEGDVNGAN